VERGGVVLDERFDRAVRRHNFRKTRMFATGMQGVNAGAWLLRGGLAGLPNSALGRRRLRHRHDRRVVLQARPEPWYSEWRSVLVYRVRGSRRADRALA